jgi:hypothetical protein
VVDAIQRAVVAPQVEISKSVLRGGRSFGIARHWHHGAQKIHEPGPDEELQGEGRLGVLDQSQFADPRIGLAQAQAEPF